MPRAVPLVLLGPGHVGRAFLSLLLARRDDLAASLGIRLEVAAIGDRSGLVRAAEGSLSDSAVLEVVERKSVGGRLIDWPSGLHGAVAAADIEGAEVERGAAPPVLVDATAADTTTSLLDARDRGWSLVLANKIPLTGSYRAFLALTAGGRGAGWETAVASSLPVVQTLQTIVDSGDEVHWISGTLSGSLGFVMEQLESGRALSDAVRAAIGLGLCEPDPRHDLNGRDVARKALILARMLGYDLALQDVRVEGLVPTRLEELDTTEFLARLPELDPAMEARLSGAGSALRFLATIGRGEIAARLAELAPHLG